MSQDSKTELPISSWFGIPRKKFVYFIVVFVVLSSLIYIVFSSFSGVFVQIGNAAFSAGNEQLGIASYKLALEFNDDLKDAINHCSYENTLHHYEIAINHCSHAIEIDKNFSTSYFQRGFAYGKLEKYDQAIADFTKSIEINPRGKKFYVVRGSTYLSKDQMDLASADCKKAIELDERYSDAYSCIAGIFISQGKYDLAITNLDKAIELDPKAKLAYYFRGLTHGIRGENDWAIADYARAIEIDPSYSDAYFQRGMIIYFTQKDYYSAISDFSKAIELDSNNADAYLQRGNAYADTGRFIEAIADYQKTLATSQDPKRNSYTNCVLGVTYTKMGNFESAITSLEQGVKIDVTNNIGWCKTALENARQGIPTP